MRRNPDGSITLSRRNLLTLLSKIDQPASARTLFAGQGGVGGFGDGPVIVRAESDEVHYANREDGGPVSPESEAFIQEHERGQNG